MSIEQWSDLMFPEREGTVTPIYGSVRAINDDGSYEVQLNASSVTTRCAPCCTAMVGDRVLVLIKPNGKCDAIGRLGGVETIAPTIAERFAELEARLAEAEYDTGWQNVYVIDSNIEVKVRRVGKMVTLVGASWGHVTLPAKSWHNITTLKSEFRPSLAVPFTINGMGSFDNELCNSSQVGADGLVRSYVSKETKYWKFSVSYPVD